MTKKLQYITIIDSFPIPVYKFGKTLFIKSFKEIAPYECCASKRETYWELKRHLLVDINRNPMDIIITKTNLDLVQLLPIKRALKT